MPPKPWITVSSRLVYENPWIRLREDIAQMPDGKTTLYGVVEGKQAVGVLPFVDEEHVLLVRQYRYVFGEGDRWEMPTGGVRDGEGLEDAARREMREEVGHEPGELEYIQTFYSSKSFLHEIAHLYIGRRLTLVRGVPDDTEFLEVATFTFEEVLRMVSASEIRDAMTVIAVLHAARARGV